MKFLYRAHRPILFVILLTSLLLGGVSQAQEKKRATLSYDLHAAEDPGPGLRRMYIYCVKICSEAGYSNLVDSVFILGVSLAGPRVKKNSDYELHSIRISWAPEGRWMSADKANTIRRGNVFTTRNCHRVNDRCTFVLITEVPNGDAMHLRARAFYKLNGGTEIVKKGKWSNVLEFDPWEGWGAMYRQFLNESMIRVNEEHIGDPTSFWANNWRNLMNAARDMITSHIRPAGRGGYDNF